MKCFFGLPVRFLGGLVLSFGFYQLSLGESPAKPMLRIATLEWAPYSSASLPELGFGVEMVKAIFDDAGYKYKIEFMPWPRLLKEVESGKSYDVGLLAYPSEERKKVYHLSDDFMHAPLGFFKLKSRDIKYTNLGDLAGLLNKQATESKLPKEVGVVNEYVNTEEFDKSPLFTKHTVNTDKNLYEMLARGRLALAVGDRANGLYIMKNMKSDLAKKAKPSPDEKVVIEGLEAIEFVQPPLIDYTLHILVSRGLPTGENVMKDFNASTAKLKAKGKLDAIAKARGY